MAERKNEAAWKDSRQMWQINVQKDGERKSFYSSKPGKKGKIEAEKKADKWLSNSTTKDNLKFGKVWEEWLDKQVKVNGEKNPTYQKNESIGRNYILPVLKFMRLSSITQQDWQNVIDTAFSERNLSKKTLKNIRGSMTTFWRYCHKCRYTLERPEDIDIPNDAAVGERKSLQPTDLITLMEKDYILRYGRQYPCHFIHFWRFQVFSGLRPGEVIGLQSGDISGNVLSIHRSVNVYNSVTRGKNKNARRTVILTDYALQELEAQRIMLKKLGIISPWIFPDEDGEHADEKAVYRRWRTYKKQHNITHASLYELRHTFVSVNAEVPKQLLKQYVGHSESMDTFGVYGHEVDGQKERTAALVQESFDKVLKRN